MGILLRESTDSWVVVSGSEVVRSRFLVENLAAVTEEVGITGEGLFLITEGIVGITLDELSVAIGDADHVAVGIEEEIAHAVAKLAADGVDAPDVVSNELIIGIFRHHIPAIQQEIGIRVCGALGGADALRVVGIAYGNARLSQQDKLTEAVVGILLRAAGRALFRQIAVGIVGIDRGCGRTA